MTVLLEKRGVFLSLVDSPTLDLREVFVDFGTLKTSTHPETGQTRTRFSKRATALVKGTTDGPFTEVFYDRDVNLDGVLNEEDEEILLCVATAFAKIQS